MGLVLLICSAAFQSPADYELPQQATVYYFHSHQCPPCRVFSEDFRTTPSLRLLLSKENGVDFKPLCLIDSRGQQDPKVAAFASAMGVTGLPTFIFVRRGVVQARHVGYVRGQWQKVAGAFEIADAVGEPPVAPQSRPAAPAPRVNSPPRTPAPTEDVNSALRQQLDQISRDIAKLQQSPPPPPVEPPKPAEQPTQVLGGAKQSPAVATAGGLSAQWGGVLSALGTAAITLLMPHVAIPTGVLGVAGVALQTYRRYRQSKRAAIGRTPDNPIIQREAGAKPLPELKYVETHVDYRGEAFVEALRRVAETNRDDHSQNVIRQIESVANSLIHGEEVCRRPKPTD